MSSVSRTINSLRNSFVALCFYFINLGLQFISRKIFLDYLGTDILGLNTTATNLLQFLNLAELGIAAAVSFTLYKPLNNKDYETISEIIKLQGSLYKKIAYLIIAGAIILMIFFPLIFKKITLPLWYAYASFGILLFNALLGYFVNYKQVLLTANQENYKVLYSYRSIMMIKVLVQMIAVKYLYYGYEWWLIFEGLFSIVASISLHHVTTQSFPYLKNTHLTYKELKAKYYEITRKIGQLFYHKIGGFVLTQTSPLIIYAITNLTTVALYGNYLLITSGVNSLVDATFNGMNASIGNLVSEGNSYKIKLVFCELFSVRFIIVTSLCFIVYSATPELIRLWIGEQYLLSNTTLIILVFTLYIRIFRSTIDSFINAYGVFQDIYAPICEAVLNLGLSIILGIYFSLNGVLLGVLISQILVVAIWKPFFLFNTKMHGYGRLYCKMYLKHLLVLLPSWFFASLLFEHLSIIKLNVFRFICISTISIIVFLIIEITFLIVARTGINTFISRFVHIESIFKK